ncbi:MAG: long-chain fatty acid--CoA ligase [Actinomycetes bacterium]
MLSTMMDVPLLLSRVVEYGASAYGTSEVITWTGGEPRRATYAEVGRRVAGLAHALRGLGIDADQRVATFMWNNQEHLEVYCAVPSMGAVLHTLNIRLFPDQLVYVANHAEDQVVVVDHTLVGLLAPLLDRMTTIRHVVVNGPADHSVLAGGGRTVHDYAELIAGMPEAFDWPVLDERSAAAMCYTSGTTGNPKGVVYSHRSNYLHSLTICMSGQLGLGPADRTLPVVPMFHANAWGVPYAALLSGSNLVMPDRFLQAEHLARMIATLQVTRSAAVPTIWTDLLAYLDTHPEADVSSLKDVLVGGSACPPSLIKAFEERFGVNVIHGWGMTETSPVGSVARPPAGLSAEDAWPYRVSQGRLLPGVEGRVIGPDGSEQPRDGQAVGELEVRGPWVAGAYYQDDDPAKFDDGWLRTGDVGSLTSDLYFTITDRAKDVIKSGGEWISSVDLENALMGHPAVLEASVVGVPDERWGERPLATVVIKEGRDVTVDQLREFLSDKVARWQVPERWAFVSTVPKTSVGKFDKKVIRRQYAEGGLDVITRPGPGASG